MIGFVRDGGEGGPQEDKRDARERQRERTRATQGSRWLHLTALLFY